MVEEEWRDTVTKRKGDLLIILSFIVILNIKDMLNFNYQNPVKILFGKGKVNELSRNIPSGAKVLMTYGGGSIKKNGVYEQVMSALEGYNVFEFAGIEANPHYETAIKAVEIIKREKIDFLLAVGGGSVIDATKFMAAAAFCSGDNLWDDIFIKKNPVKEALPIGVILTLPATGSEMNKNAVLTKFETREKLAFYSTAVMPRFSILDPTYTYSLPCRQLVNGVVDAFVHVLEQYLTYPVNTPVQDHFSEGLLLTLIEEGRQAFADEIPDYDNRANIVWAATLALNGLIASGVQECWATHKIGHELTAFHGLDHALTLAIVLPGLMDFLRVKRREKLLQYAERVWDISNGSDDEKIDAAISETEAFFREFGMLTRMEEHGIGQDTIDKIVARFQERGLQYPGMQSDVTVEDVALILQARL